MQKHPAFYAKKSKIPEFQKSKIASAEKKGSQSPEREGLSVHGAQPLSATVAWHMTQDSPGLLGVS